MPNVFVTFITESSDEEIQQFFANLEAEKRFEFYRLSDAYIKYYGKKIEENELAAEMLFSPFDSKNMKTARENFASGKVVQSIQELNNLAPELVNANDEQKVAFGDLEKAAQESIKREKEFAELIRKLEFGKKAIPLTEEEKKNLYPSLEGLYQQQIKKRKWYHHGALAAGVGILFLPFSPLVYMAWKQSRNKEDIQLNPHNQSQTEFIRQNRKNFKVFANSQQEEYQFITQKKESKQHPEKYLTRFKLERDKYFRKHHEFFFKKFEKVDKGQLETIKISKEIDINRRAELGMR